MLEINWADVEGVLQNVRPQLIGFGVVAILAVVVMIACLKMAKPTKFLIRCEAGLAIFLALVITVNAICLGPMSSMIDLATGSGSISEGTSNNALTLAEDVAREGIVLLQNDDGLLPLAKDSNVNLFGWSSTNPVYGGTGSGSLNDAYHTVSLIEGMENAGFKINSDLVKFYTDYRADRPTPGMWNQEWTIVEPPAANYPGDLINGAQTFSDVALVVISRPGGENSDLPADMAAVLDGSWVDGSTYRNSSFTGNSDDYAEFEAGQHYLELSKSERDMVELVCSNFDDVVLVYNGAAAMELGFVADHPQIKSVLWCPAPGQIGFNALGEILNGTVNPSGRSADTFVYDLASSPAWNNSVPHKYDNMDEFNVPGLLTDTPSTPSFINYVEGIYVGYKWYETAAVEGVIDYDSTVLYPFGHGLSYTDFSQEITSFADNGTSINMTVRVSNEGSVAGKDVVEVYYNPPYTSGGIEKASANLVAFAKTSVIEAGAFEDVTITFDVEDMAAYDSTGAGGYVLDAGDYIISINSDSHTVLDSEVYTAGSTVNYTTGRDSDDTPAVNQFGFAEGDVTYLSRTDGFANYDEVTAAPANYSLAAEYKATFFNNSNYDPTAYNDSNDAMPNVGVSGSLQLVDLRGADYDDERWEQLIDQMPVSEMNELIALGGFQTVAAPSVGKIATTDCDGPAAINNNFTRVGSVGFPCSVMIACTWSQQIAHDFGDSIGTMADEMGVSGWYAPAMNIHRNPLSGRNFEYYSEDGYLSGAIASNAVRGAREHGVYAYMKHFALNDTEDRRNDMICVWANEQAIREIYLKPFELCVKDGGCQAAMSSFNYIGTTYAGGCDALLNTVLRGEWGFQGFVLTDYYAGYGYQDADQCIRNGNDMCLATYDTGTNYVTDTTSATSLLAMRQAVKNVLFTVVNSRAYEAENLNPGMAAWRIILIVVDVVLAAAFIALELVVIRSWKRKSKAV